MEYQPVRRAGTARTRPTQVKHSDSAYYKRFTRTSFVREYAPVTSISFVPISAFSSSSTADDAQAETSSSGSSKAPLKSSERSKFLVTAGSRVQIYASSGKLQRTVGRFSDVARGATWRADGRLFVAGDDSGTVQVFDANSRSILRTLKGHKHPVHVSKFSSDSGTILTGSDDRTLKLWDVATQSCTRTLRGHSDYVRTAVVSPDNPALVLSGGYDGSIRLWDTRLGRRRPPTTDGDTMDSDLHGDASEGSDACVMTMKHGAPVESTLIYPTGGGGIALSAGGPSLRVWDLMMGGRCLRAVSNHSKTITSLALSTGSDADFRSSLQDTDTAHELGASSGSPQSLRLLSAGLDGLVKVYDPARDYAVTHTMRYPSPLLSLAVSADDTVFATGAADGTLCVRSRILKKGEAMARTAHHQQAAQGTHKVFMDALSSAGAQTASAMDVAATVRTKKLKVYDDMLKQFRYADALDAALKANVPPEVTLGVLAELRRRSSADGTEDGLRRGLCGRDEEGLIKVLKFCLRHAGNPEHVNIISDTLDRVIDIYAPILGQSPQIDDLFGRLWSKISDEVRVQRDVAKVRGALDMIVARSTLGSAVTA
ncbi:WD40 repeat-like protein [Ceraceosorus guamensis]|uniref:WD40 repeat-like protein n=1 Tax=Ceraceosorus guamensis TaxID=1522189 RepID=A0A316VX27_9BASI|nr:WD40 repeat-like protein [Ceraceosorus guamensis]PWN41854.1 WD40 repeat-like protein [Ceraceosorus guamensis]